MQVCGYGEGRITWVRDSKAGTRVNRAQILEACDKVLTRLQTDHVDLFQIHWPDRYVPLFGAPAYDLKLEREAVPFEEQLEAFQTLVEAGKARNRSPFFSTYRWCICRQTRLCGASVNVRGRATSFSLDTGPLRGSVQRDELWRDEVLSARRVRPLRTLSCEISRVSAWQTADAARVLSLMN